MQPRTRNILIGISLSLIAGYVSVRWLFPAFLIPKTTTDLAAYPSTLNQWSASGLVAHFPTTIPPHANNAKFSAFPGYLQGGAHIQLRLQLPADQIKSIQQKLEPSTTFIDMAAPADPHDPDPKNSWPIPRFETSDDPQTTRDFPAHFKLYRLSAKTSSSSWNHGQTTGIALSPTTNEVIYWAEAW